MKPLRTIAKAVAIVAAAILITTFPIEASFVARAQRVQRVLPSEQSELFGETGENIGTPQRVVIDDPKAFMTGDLADGTKRVNETYLQDNRIYPLQLQTVVAVLNYVRIGALTATLISMIAVVRTRQKGAAPNES